MEMDRDREVLQRQVKPQEWILYQGIQLLSFLGSHEISRIADPLRDERHLPLMYALCFGMPDISSICYGNTWRIRKDREQGGQPSGVCLEIPVFQKWMEWILMLEEAKKQSEALKEGSWRCVLVTDRQLIFERKTERERVLVAINAAAETYMAHFDAGCGTAVDLISGKIHDFGGGSALPPAGVFYWKMEKV